MSKKTSSKTEKPATTKSARSKTIAESAKKLAKKLAAKSDAQATKADLKKTLGRDSANPLPAVVPAALTLPSPDADMTKVMASAVDGLAAQAAIASSVAASPSTPAVKDVVKKSTAESPTKLVWEIADQMRMMNPHVRRRDVVNACIAAGIATHTARTQYQRWFTAQKGATK